MNIGRHLAIWAEIEESIARRNKRPFISNEQFNRSFLPISRRNDVSRQHFRMNLSNSTPPLANERNSFASNE